MGGASSYYAMLSICGFLSAAWGASKLSRLVGVSSIVLEITTGVVFGPKVLGLIVDEYAVCEHSRHAICEAPTNVVELAKSGTLVGELAKFSNKDICDYEHWEHHGEHHVEHSMQGEHAGDASGHQDGHDALPLDGESSAHLDGEHSDGHESGEHEEQPSGHESGEHSGDHGTEHQLEHGRKLSGGSTAAYTSFKECLEKTCEAEINHACGLTPDVFTLIGHAGVALMIFESGMHFDFEKAKVVGVPACIVAVCGTILPLVVGTALMIAFQKPLMPHGISAGTALAPTSVGIALRLLGEAGVLQENFGQAIITAAFVDDILSLVLFNVLFSLGGEFDLFKVVLAPIIGIAFMLFCMVLAVKFWPPVINRIIIPQAPQNRDEAGLRGWRRIRLEQDELLFLLQIIFLVAYSLVTHLLGTHLWGCFIAGMSFACLNPPHHAHHVWVKQTKRMTTWMIRIFFACTVAFSIPVAKLLSISAFWKGSIMGVFACILTKVCCAPFMGPARWVIGWAMVGRAEFAYLIAQMALSSNMLDEESFSIVIWALLYATIFAPFIFRFLLNRYVKSQGLEGRGGEGHPLSDNEANEDYEYGEHHTDKGKRKMEMGDGADGLQDLEAIDVSGMKGKGNKSLKARNVVAPELADMAPAVGRGRTAGAKPSGDGFLCCLFFKKLIIQ